MSTVPASVLDRLSDIVGPDGAVTGADCEPYLIDERGRYRGASAMVLRPATVQQVATVVELCAHERIGIVPQGGNTGLVGGSVPDASGDQVVVSTTRLNRVRAIDVDNFTISVDAGCILETIQAAAAAADRLFPLSLASEGSCQIGGTISTNAGGTGVLRYGNMRELVLGLEVVLPNGEVWNGMHGLRKNNTGYDLKQLFVGAEGTLGIVTAATRRLFPQPTESTTYFAAVRNVDAAVEILAGLRRASSDRVAGYEYMHRACLDLVFQHIADVRDPLSDRYTHYVLAELECSADSLDTEFQAQIEAGLIEDAVVAASAAQRKQLWTLRESIPIAQKRAGGGLKHDIGVPISNVASFLQQAESLVRQTVPDAMIIAFGHLGDGNIHYNIAIPPDVAPEHFGQTVQPITDRIHDLAMRLGGTFSAEHGIGQLRKPELLRYRSSIELELMRSVKRALDPLEIMNPGKLIDSNIT